jgi:hypothetical protein
MFDEKSYSIKMDKAIDVFLKELSIADLKIKEFYRIKIGE